MINYEEAIEEIKKKAESYGYVTITELKEIFGEENLFHIHDYEEMMPKAYGIYYMKCKEGYLLFPQDDDEDIDISNIEKMNENWASDLEDMLEKYKTEMEKFKESIENMEELIKSQRIRRIFKGKS